MRVALLVLVLLGSAPACSDGDTREPESTPNGAGGQSSTSSPNGDATSGNDPASNNAQPPSVSAEPDLTVNPSTERPTTSDPTALAPSSPTPEPTTAAGAGGGASLTGTGGRENAGGAGGQTSNPAPAEPAGGDSGPPPAAGGTGGEGQGPVVQEPLAGDPMHEERAPLTSVRQEHSAAALGGEVYVVGGFVPSVAASVQAYDPELDSWRDVADFPEALHHANVAATDEQLYVLGFNRGGGFNDIDGRTFAYDPNADTWTELTSMPLGTERSSSCTAALGDDIYLFGGSTNTGGNGPTVADASVYHTALDEWEVLPNLPELREHCVAGAIGSKMYILSGRSGGIGSVSPASFEFDPATSTFTELAPIPTPRGGAAGAVLGGRLFIFGGEGNDEDPNGIFHEVEVYDPDSDSWERLPDMLIPRHGYAAAVVDGRVYLPGGATSQGFGADDAHTVFFFE